MQVETLPISQVSAEEEERLMTYQVTMCGNDGVVVASDRCEVWTDQDGRKIKTTNKVKKLFIDSMGEVAWTFSGGYLSSVTAHYLKNAIEKQGAGKNEEDVKKAIQDCAERACRSFPITNRIPTDVLVEFR
jgi:hypothetical protein